MRAVVQRVTKAKLTCEGITVSEIGKGFLVFVGFCDTDTKENVEIISKKIGKLRIFDDENDRINLSLIDVSGEILLVSNFTLYGDAFRSNRPNFMRAGKSEIAKPLYDHMLTCLSTFCPTKKCAFGKHMIIETIEDGPLNILLEYPKDEN